MIGILLALQVNHWNEGRKQKNEVKGILQSISIGMVIDTTSATEIIKFYEENSKNSMKIINREITMQNYKDSLPCIGLVTSFQPFNVQRSGFERLKNENSSLEKDTLISNIINVYS